MLIDKLGLGKLHQTVRDICHQVRNIYDYQLTNDWMQWIHIELCKDILSTTAYGSVSCLSLKNNLKLYFKHLKNFVTARFHMHERDAIHRIDLNCIRFIESFKQQRDKYTTRSKNYHKWNEYIFICESVQFHWFNYWILDSSEHLDCSSTVYQSPNYPWHNQKADVNKLIAHYQRLLYHLPSYYFKLLSMTDNEFSNRKYLLSNSLLKLLPSFKRMCLENDKIYVDGDIDKVNAKYTKKRYKSDDEKAQHDSKKNRLKQLLTKYQIHPRIIIKKNKDYCPGCH